MNGPGEDQGPMMPEYQGVYNEPREPSDDDSEDDEEDEDEEDFDDEDFDELDDDDD